MRKSGLFIAVLICLLLGGSFLVGIVAALLTGGAGGGSWHGELFGDQVGVVRIEGTILSSREAVENLERFRKDDDIRAVIVRLETPGGSVAASQEIFEEVKRVNAEKPVIASMGAVAASGGYYIACGARRIFANPGTITGSIGVRLEHVMIGDLLRWAKIEHETFKSGRLKDMLAIDQPVTPEARAIVQEVLGEMHRQFKEAVAAQRKLAMEEVDPLADGRIFTGQEALEHKLVDELGGLVAAAQAAAKVAGIEGEPELVTPKKRIPILDRFIESSIDAVTERWAFGWNG